MTSLLTEELKNYQTSTLGKKTIIKINNINNDILNNDNQEEGIINKNNFTSKNIDEYRINVNIFNPGKQSPPNIWHNRLMNRLNTLNNIALNNE